MALGGGVSVGVGGCGGVMGTGGGSRPGGLFVVLCRGVAWGAGARAYADPWARGHGLRLGVGLGSARAAVAGHLLDVSRYRELVGGQKRCCLVLAFLWLVGGCLWAWGAGFDRSWDEVRRASAAARSAIKVVAAVLVTTQGRCARRCCRQVWDG